MTESGPSVVMGTALTEDDGTSTPRVLVVALGGTIAMTTSNAGGVTPSRTAQQLVDAVPGLEDTGIDIHVLTFRTKPGASLTFDDLIELIDEIGKRSDGCRTAGGAAEMLARDRAVLLMLAFPQ